MGAVEQARPEGPRGAPPGAVRAVAGRRRPAPRALVSVVAALGALTVPGAALADPPAPKGDGTAFRTGAPGDVDQGGAFSPAGIDVRSRANGVERPEPDGGAPFRIGTTGSTPVFPELADPDLVGGSTDTGVERTPSR